MELSKNGKEVKIRQVSAIVGVCLLAAILCLPVIQTNLQLFPDLKSEENRVLAQRPILKRLTTADIVQYIRGYETFFDDNFGFRNALIRVNSLVNLRIFGVSPTPLSSMVVGKDGWLFYNVPDDGASFTDYFGLAVFSGNKLQAIAQNIEKMKAFCAARGIMFILVITPSKHTIYEEYLPSGLAMLKGEMCRADQLVQLWGKNSRDTFLIDLRPTMRSARGKISYPLYYKTDSHWNYLGAFLATMEIMKVVCTAYPEAKRLALSDFDISSETVMSGDLAKMINMNSLMKEAEVVLKPIRPFSARQTKIVLGDYRFASQSETTNNPTSPKALLFGDSFARYMFSYLAESFSRGLYLAAPLTVDFTIVEKERPDVLIVELTERYAGSLKIRWSEEEGRPQRWVFPPPQGQ